jgi:hypothetical protein
MARLITYLQIILMLSSALAFAGQRSPEIGAIGLKAWTHDKDLRHPYGIGFYLFQPVSDKVKLTFEFDYLTSTTRNTVFDYTNYYSDQEMVQLTNTNRVHAFELGFRRLIGHSRSEFLEFGGGLCFVHINAKSRVAESGYIWSSPDALRVGIAINIGILVADQKSLPVTMRFGFRHRFLGGSREMYIPESTPVFDDAITTTEVSWGFGYQFGC